jgi:hypothetical protein
MDPPTPTIQQLVTAFDGVVDQGVEEFNNLDSTTGVRSEDEILAAKELQEYADCKEDPAIAPIPDPSDEEMRAFGIQVTEDEAKNELDEAATDHSQAEDSSVDSAAADLREEANSDASTSGNSTASVFQTVEFQRWERRKDKRDRQEQRAELNTALQQNNTTLLTQLSAVLSNQLAPVQQNITTTQQKVDDLQAAHTAMKLTLVSTVEAEVKRQLAQSTKITQTLRGDLLAATESSTQQQQTLATATAQAKEAEAQFKAAKLTRLPRQGRITRRANPNSFNLWRNNSRHGRRVPTSSRPLKRKRVHSNRSNKVSNPVK